MANQAGINATPEQKAIRNVGRIERLRLAMAKPNITDERKAALQAELDRRMTDIEELKKALEAV